MKSIVVDANVYPNKNAPLYEMENLLMTLDITIDFICSQNMNKINSSFYIGKGLLEELRQYVKENGINVVVFNNDLSPLQIQSLQEYIDVPIFDRSMIILKIFEMRANSKEAKLQVEVAYLKYMASRLIEKDMNYSQVTSGGAKGLTNRGAGEKAIDIKRYLIKRRIKEKEEELKKVVQVRKNQRKGRLSYLPVVAIVGYTNAGKSTLMNNFIRLSKNDKKDEILEENRLFATLSTSTRLIKTDRCYPFLLTDTVGFISDLPTSLIKAFRSTLEEIKEADLLIQVVDISSLNYLQEMQVTKETLEQIGVANKNIIYLYNKYDNATLNNLPFVNENELIVSLKDDSYMEQIIDLISANIASELIEVNLFIPYENSNDFYTIKNEHYVKEVLQEEKGYSCIVVIPKVMFNKYACYFGSSNK